MWIDYDADEPFLRPAYYEVENMKLWETLHKVFQSTPSYQYMKMFAKAKDGRRAYLALKAHYLGPNNANNLAQATATKLDQLRYTGENRRWNMQRYVTAHVECFNVLDGLREYGFSGMDEATRVRKFVAGIKTDKLDAIRAAVLANPTLSFDRVTRLYRDHVAMTQSMNPIPQDHRQVSDVRAAGSREDVEDRYYTREEYNKLTADQKFSLKRKREGRGGNKKGNYRNQLANPNKKLRPTKKTQYEKHYPLVKAAMKAATRQVAAMSLADEEEPEETESEEEAETPVAVKQRGTNRGHPALEKRKRKGGRQ
jgi:hypothetical protein